MDQFPIKSRGGSPGGALGKQEDERKGITRKGKKIIIVLSSYFFFSYHKERDRGRREVGER